MQKMRQKNKKKVKAVKKAETYLYVVEAEEVFYFGDCRGQWLDHGRGRGRGKGRGSSSGGFFMTFFMKNINIYWILENLTETVLQLTKQIENDSKKRAMILQNRAALDFVFAERRCKNVQF